MVCVHACLIETCDPLSKCLFSCIPQLKNSLKDNLCLDQGPDTENVPIMYLCHGMTPQVSALSLCSALCFLALLIQPFSKVLITRGDLGGGCLRRIIGLSRTLCYFE